MKHVALLLSAISMLFCVNAYSDEIDPEFIRFAKVIHMHEQIDEQIQALRVRSEKAGQMYTQQVFNSFSAMPDDLKARFLEEAKVYVSNVHSSLDADYAVNKYIELISKKMAVDEIKKVTEFYESDVGRKYTEVNTAIMGEWAVAFMGEFDRKLKLHLKNYADKLAEVALEYKKSHNQ